METATLGNWLGLLLPVLLLAGLFGLKYLGRLLLGAAHLWPASFIAIFVITAIGLGLGGFKGAAVAATLSFVAAGWLGYGIMKTANGI